MKEKSDSTTIEKILNWSYETASYKLGNDNEEKKYTKEELSKIIDKIIKYACAQAFAGGLVTNSGGIILIPITLPTNLTTLLLIQLRMVIKIAAICGFDTSDESTRAMCFACLVGSGAGEIIKKSLINEVTKITTKQIKTQISGQVIKTINKKVGTTLITKTGTTGTINLVKLVPLVGGTVGGSADAASTYLIGKMAKKIFLDGEI